MSNYIKKIFFLLRLVSTSRKSLLLYPKIPRDHSSLIIYLCRLKCRGIRFQSKQTIILISTAVSATTIFLMSQSLSVSLSSYFRFEFFIKFMISKNLPNLVLGNVLYNSHRKLCGIVQTFIRLVWVKISSK